MGTKFGRAWWIADDGFLGDTADPTVELGAASELFPDEYTPTVFLTGDAHREPPFQWATRGRWVDFFRPLIAENLVVCHVEQYQTAVKHSSVPALFAPVFEHGKVFGWEHAIFPIIADIINRYRSNANIFPGGVTRGFVRELLRDTSRVAGMGYLKAEDNALFVLSKTLIDPLNQVHGLHVVNDNTANKLLSVNDGMILKDLYSAYNNAAMQLRTDIHPVIAPSIQSLINRYDDHIHLITCGDAHLIDNPLYQYLEPPIGCFGVVDKRRN